MKIGILQLNTIVGDFKGNLEKTIVEYKKACEQGAELVVGNELGLWGYYPHDILQDVRMRRLQGEALLELCSHIGDIGLVIGATTEHEQGGKPYNSSVLIHNGEIVHRQHKTLLPDYLVFREARHFKPADRKVKVFNYKGKSLAMVVCEDIWFDDEPGLYEIDPLESIKWKGVDILTVINASPYYDDKQVHREKLLHHVQQKYGIQNIVYANHVGGHDELVFDGGGTILCEDEKFRGFSKLFEEGCCVVDTKSSNVDSYVHSIDSVYRSLVVATRDYVNKNGFLKGVVIGLSGGIDSALTLAIAYDALGNERVQAVMMPYKYTRDISLIDAKEQAELLGVEYSVRPINKVYEALVSVLAPEIGDDAPSITEENLQARARGTILMGISNKQGSIVLSTGNKSEMAVGYSTLYGDMAGGFNPLKDVYKTLVYELARYRNTIGRAIPKRVINREPSAELAPNQLDTNSLPSYDELDFILEQYIDLGMTRDEVIGEKEVVSKVLRMVENAEHKRKQSAPGPRITKRALSGAGGRVYPITKKL